jgi:protein gp37
MGDLFHPAGKNWWVDVVLQTIRECPQHTFMVLTKRPEYMRNHIWNWPKNLWAGVTIELADYIGRLNLLTTQANGADTEYPVRFVSCEPLLGPIPGLMRNGPRPDWVIVGCESGHGRRTMDIDWARGIRDQCVEAEVPFFLKQMEVDGKLVKMPELDGRVWAERPTVRTAEVLEAE